ncbi:glycosyltransferase [Prochlorococcus marinus XMU1410]|uniref:glycosyltransferase n=1 Tax=Prochlorococcus marinus TaxID=1219 RepID=UPI001ADD4C5C|nr:glycosyltransferase [Prochlorococcus marinus]MBO8242374.1 glycosyltransferase [Prochlorococcus marinus XMU1410]MBW3053522.1 hypothetical protein [Prochlorococcus marinus str. MU1410]
MNSFVVLVPTQNSYKMIMRLAKSVQDQSFKRWKVIFIDGESQPEHVNWLKELCFKDKRFFYIKQKENFKGIFGAMNQGVEKVDLKNWLLFWGSDDWVIKQNTFEKLNYQIQKYSHLDLDLMICKGKYYNLDNSFYKNTYFKNIRNTKFIKKEEYIRYLFFGLTPPHQTTLINPNLFNKYKYNDDYQIAGDLNFFCRLCQEKKLSIVLLDLYIVSISVGGISSRNHNKRLTEVIDSYYLIFSKLFFIPFLTRYLRKILLLK